MKNLYDYILEQEETINQEPLEGGVDVALAGELFYYSENNYNFAERKQLMVDQFKERLSIEDRTTEYIMKTPVFKLYIKHLKDDYKANVDENFKINMSTDDDLRRQVASSIVLMINEQPVV